MSAEQYLQVTLAFILGTIAVARISRLLTFDEFPPTRAVREWYVRKAGDNWGPLFLCPFCIGPYLALIETLWFGLAYTYSPWWYAAWWWCNAAVALSYTSAMVVVRDEPDDDG